MSRRYVAIWFRYLVTDWMARRNTGLKDLPFVLAAPEHGRMVVTAASVAAHAKGIAQGTVVADCRAIYPGLEVFDDEPGRGDKLLNALAEWCLRFTPVAGIDPPDGVLLDISGCPHLWGGELPYLKDILTRLEQFGYHVRVAIADTIGTAWAVARFGQHHPIIDPARQSEALAALPPAALRIEHTITAKLEKLGLYRIKDFMGMPRTALRRRFGEQLLNRLDQALGNAHEALQPVCPIAPYEERLPSLEPIRTATGIEIALQKLLEALCGRLEKEHKGLRSAALKCYRIDSNTQQVKIGTNRATRNIKHLFKLFEIKIPLIEPALGIELFILEALIVEDLSPEQEAIWSNTAASDDAAVAELLDRLTGKVTDSSVRRYLPREQHWPERSYKVAISLQEKSIKDWPDLPRPLHLLSKPEPIEVTVPMPDYPPMLFIYKDKLHNISKADGPERIEQEWWQQKGFYRDYYCVEDEAGARYWLFRFGSYTNTEPKWFIHGFFA